MTATPFAPVHTGYERFITCGVCPCNVQLPGAESDDEARREAMVLGWKVDEYGSWHCPDCVEAYACDRNWWTP